MKRRILFLALLAVTSVSAFAQKRISASSPNGQTTVSVTLSDRIYYDVQSHGETVLQQCHVGMEFNGNCRPDNSLWLPFMRNAVGPMDYTPGSMLCYQPELHHGNRPICAGVGTKAYNMALFVLFESNLQMLMDNPCRYDMWPDCRDFLVSVPVNWDETRVLAAEAGQYIVTAKRKGDEWFIGAITNSTPRELTVSLDFLPAGSHRMVSFADGVNADRMAMDYVTSESDVDASTTLNLKLVKNGGFTAKIK